MGLNPGSLVPGSGLQVSGSKFRFQDPGSKFQLPVSRFQVSLSVGQHLGRHPGPLWYEKRRGFQGPTCKPCLIKCKFNSVVQPCTAKRKAHTPAARASPGVHPGSHVAPGNLGSHRRALRCIAVHCMALRCITLPGFGLFCIRLHCFARLHRVWNPTRAGFLLLVDFRNARRWTGKRLRLSLIHI